MKSKNKNYTVYMSDVKTFEQLHAVITMMVISLTGNAIHPSIDFNEGYLEEFPILKKNCYTRLGVIKWLN